MVRILLRLHPRLVRILLQLHPQLVERFVKLVEMATFVVHLFLVKLVVNQKIVPVSRGEYSLKENVHQEDTVRASSIVCTLQSLLIWFVRSCYGAL